MNNQKSSAVERGYLIERIAQNDFRISQLENALSELIGIAEKCDGWESFPSKALDDANEVLLKGRK